MIPADLLLKGPGLGETVGFAVIAAVLLGAALASVLASRTFHAVMFLGAVLVTMGALFILLGSALVGVLQVLVYVGGILTLFIFAVMFVTGDEEERAT
jgi:NADH:ubiquinone oxidoreductase subunit 6 (subunit J)